VASSAPCFPPLDELDIALLAYRPLGGGFLAGAMPPIDVLEEGDFRRHDPRFGQGNLPHNQGFANALAAVAAKKQVTPAQLALAWLLHKGPRVLPIPGAKSVAHISANAEAAEIALVDDEIAELEASAPKTTAGDRYPAEFMSSIDSE
jgi:aryl-alcohol dehydrogenase-like predicted oxidoreductase